MRMSRLVLSVFMAALVALAPAGSAFASGAGAAAIAAQAKVAQIKVAQIKVAMKDCHHSAPEPAHTSGPQPGHCPDCGSDGSCNAACLSKCFQVTATIEPAKQSFRSPVRHVAAIVSAEPPGWAQKPPAPPPRA